MSMMRVIVSSKFEGLSVPKIWLNFGHGVKRPCDLELRPSIMVRHGMDRRRRQRFMPHSKGRGHNSVFLGITSQLSSIIRQQRVFRSPFFQCRPIWVKFGRDQLLHCGFNFTLIGAWAAPAEIKFGAF